MTQADRADAFRGMAHPLRRKVLRQLTTRKAGVGQLQEMLKVSQPALSRHLAILRETGLVRQHMVGRQRVYQLNERKVNQAKNWLDKVG